MDGDGAGEMISSRGERCGVVVGVSEGWPRWETGGKDAAV